MVGGALSVVEVMTDNAVISGDDYSEDEIERRKREYSADIYVYTKGLCESMGMKARPL